MEEGDSIFLVISFVCFVSPPRVVVGVEERVAPLWQQGAAWLCEGLPVGDWITVMYWKDTQLSWPIRVAYSRIIYLTTRRCTDEIPPFFRYINELIVSPCSRRIRT